MNWSGLDPTLLWGLIPRCVGLLFLLAFGALTPQILSLLGSRGAVPIAPRLDRMRRDFPGVRRFFEFPTVFWLNASDGMIRAVPLIGVFASLLAVYGGTPGYVGLVICWLLWISVEPAGLIFPWDTMLQEAGFFALFLPIVEPLPSFETTALPLPTVTFMFRWLVLRLMLGFAKVKFIGTGKGDGLYLRGFMIWAPLPTPLAWWGHHAPRWLLKMSLYFMFFGEAIAPVLGFFTGPLRLVSFGTMAMLMVGIQLTGNWGYFNIGFVMLSLSLLDLNASVFDVFSEPWASRALTAPDVFVHVTMALLFFNSLVYFVITNSWISRTWVHWRWEHVLYGKPIALALIRWFRALAPFHLVNGYGVFPPTAAPPIRFAPVFEGSNDGGKTWRGYGFKYLPSRPDSALPLVAPHHPRFDQALTYGSIGMHDGSFFSHMVGDGNPYLSYLKSCWLDRAGQHILRATPEMKRDIGENPFPDAPPTLVRVSTYVLAPTTPSELRQTGNRWRVRRLGTLIPARGAEPWLEELAIPEPELFNPEYVHYKRQAAPLRAIVRAFKEGQDPDRAIIADSALTERDVQRFWDEFIPELNVGRGDWPRLHERAQALKDRFGFVQIHMFERIMARYAWLLREQTEPYHERGATPKIEIGSLLRYELLLNEIIMDGHDACHAVLRDPTLAAARVATSTDATQLWSLGLIRYDMTMFHVCTFRWHEIGRYMHKFNIPGIFEFFPLLVETVPPDEEFCPQITKHDDGEFTVEGLYPTTTFEEPRTA